MPERPEGRPELDLDALCEAAMSRLLADIEERFALARKDTAASFAIARSYCDANFDRARAGLSAKFDNAFAKAMKDRDAAPSKKP